MALALILVRKMFVHQSQFGAALKRPKQKCHERHPFRSLGQIPGENEFLPRNYLLINSSGVVFVPSGKKGDVLTVEFTVMGILCIGLNGGPSIKHSWAFSFQVATTDQAETDRYWKAIVGNGGEESQCGWRKDKWGLSWQITPTALTKALADPDAAAAKRAFDAMMTMKKIDIAAIEAAHRG